MSTTEDHAVAIVEAIEGVVLSHRTGPPAWRATARAALAEAIRAALESVVGRAGGLSAGDGGAFSVRTPGVGGNVDLVETARTPGVGGDVYLVDVRPENLPTCRLCGLPIYRSEAFFSMRLGHAHVTCPAHMIGGPPVDGNGGTLGPNVVDGGTALAGTQHERAAIVAWLRDPERLVNATIAAGFADEIERGEHHKPRAACSCDFLLTTNREPGSHHSTECSYHRMPECTCDADRVGEHGASHLRSCPHYQGEHLGEQRFACTCGAAAGAEHALSCAIGKWNR